jgi:hypothetical protein
MVMDRNLENRWRILPKVEVESDESLLLIDGKPVSLPDITPSMLADYIDIGQYSIHTHLNERTKQYRLLGDRITRPLILLGRFAVLNDESSALTDEALAVENDVNLDRDDLKGEFQGFWMVIEETNYVPEIRRKLTLSSPKLDGTWLSLRRLR